MANYDCDTNTAPNVGPIYNEVTIEYPPNALSTGVCYHTNWRPINYTELYYPPPDYEVITQAACSMDYGDPRTIDASPILAGSPIFSIPGDVSQVDPLWSTCTPAAPGGYDPPRVLTKTNNLVPPPTSPPVTQAKPEPSATLQFAAETGAPSSANEANIGQLPQDPSITGGTDPQDSNSASSPGAASGGALDSTTGKQESDSGSRQAPDGKGNQPEPQSPGNSNVPSIEIGGSLGSTTQINDGNVGSGSAEVSKADGAGAQDSGVSTAPAPISKVDPGSLSHENDSNGESVIGAPLQEAPGGGVQLGTMTIAPGAQTTHSGHIFSIGSKFVLVDGTSFDLLSLHSGAPPRPTYTSAPSQQDISDGVVIVGTMTVPSGVQTIYSGHTISLGSKIFPVAGNPYSRAAGGGRIFGTMRLPPGSQVTQSGHIISVGSSSVVVDGISYTWAARASPATITSTSDSIGGLILSAFGTGPAATSSESSTLPLAFTGDTTKLRVLLKPRLPTMMMVTYIMFIYML